jgi:hypothetical protein
MTKIHEVLTLLSIYFPTTPLADAMEIANKIEVVYTPLTPESWAAANVNDYRADHKIQFIKDIRGAVPGTSLVDSKNAAEAAITQYSLDKLRAKLLGHPVDAYTSATDSYDLGENEDRAYAEYRERMSERGTWFGTPGPLDEEPSF